MPRYASSFNRHHSMIQFSKNECLYSPNLMLRIGKNRRRSLHEKEGRGILEERAR